MDTAGSAVTGSRRRPAFEPNYSCSIYSSEDLVLEEVYRSDAAPSPPLADPLMSHYLSLDARDLYNFEDHFFHCQDCQKISRDLWHPIYLRVLFYMLRSSRSNSALANEIIGINDEPYSDPTYPYYNVNPTVSIFGGAFPAPSPACPPSNDIVSRRLADDLVDLQTCQDLSEGSSHPMQRLGSLSTRSSSRPQSLEMVNEAIGVNDEAPSVPTQSRHHASLLPNTKTAGCIGYITSMPSQICHRWLGSLLGLGSLTLAIVSLLMYTLRSYRMAVWTTRNDELQACTGLIQVRELCPSECC